MPRKSRFKLPSLDLGEETIGQRIARLRKERGYTQIELADKIGIIQNLVSAYERDQLRLSSEMIIRFALALEVSSDDLLGISSSKESSGRKQAATKKPSLKLLRRLNRIESLPMSQQKTLLQTIDTFLKAAGK
jgi:transcriptional regulator with XRE-family HTH domain